MSNYPHDFTAHEQPNPYNLPKCKWFWITVKHPVLNKSKLIVSKVTNNDFCVWINNQNRPFICTITILPGNKNTCNCEDYDYLKPH